MADNDRRITSKPPCWVEGCDQPQIGPGRLDDPYAYDEDRDYVLPLCPGHFADAQAEIYLDSFALELRRRRLEQERAVQDPPTISAADREQYEHEAGQVGTRLAVALLTAIRGARSESEYDETVFPVLDDAYDMNDVYNLVLTLAEWHLWMLDLVHEGGGPSPDDYLQHMGAHGAEPPEHD
jgi:hypothetical protein